MTIFVGWNNEKHVKTLANPNDEANLLDRPCLYVYLVTKTKTLCYTFT